jgi:hypothetical protein
MKKLIEAAVFLKYYKALTYTANYLIYSEKIISICCVIFSSAYFVKTPLVNPIRIAMKMI